MPFGTQGRGAAAQALGIHAVENQAHAGLCQAFSHRKAEPARPAGDQGGAAGQIKKGM